jgi:hypothetical protein
MVEFPAVFLINPHLIFVDAAFIGDSSVAPLGIVKK